MINARAFITLPFKWDQFYVTKNFKYFQSKRKYSSLSQSQCFNFLRSQFLAYTTIIIQLLTKEPQRVTVCLAHLPTASTDDGWLISQSLFGQSPSHNGKTNPKPHWLYRESCSSQLNIGWFWYWLDKRRRLVIGFESLQNSPTYFNNKSALLCSNFKGTESLTYHRHRIFKI